MTAQSPPNRPKAPYEGVFVRGLQYLQDHPILVFGLLVMLLAVLVVALVPKALDKPLPYALLGMGILLIGLDFLIARFQQRADQGAGKTRPGQKEVLPPPAPPRRRPDPDALRARYLREQLDRCAHVPMTTIDIKAATREEAAQLDLAAVFTDLDIHDAGWEEVRERKRGEPGPEMAQADRRLPVLAALSRYPHLVLLGDPGSGKSTLVNFVTLCLAGEWLGSPDANLHRLGDEWQLGRLLPIRVVLRDYAARGLPDGKGLWDFIGEELARVETRDGPLSDCLPVIQEHLEQKNGAILLLDGVDEVPEAHRYRLRLKEAVKQFASDFPHCRILVTSRPYAYQDPKAHLARFEVRRLAPFTPEQVERFIRRWYEHVGVKDPSLGPTSAARYADQLTHTVQTNPRIAELAPNPLLLTLMASLHRWREGGSLPERRQELYEQSVRLLLDLWQRPKQVFDAEGNLVGEEYDVFTELGIPQDNLRAALNRVAYEAHWKQPALTGTHDIRACDLAGALYEASTDKGKAQGEERIIRYLIDRAGLLIEREQGRIYTFPHRTFQEYLAACYLADEDYPYLLAERLREDDARWREATLLAAAKAATGSTSTIWTLLAVLCPHDWPPLETPADADWYAALRAAQAMIETEQHLRVTDRQRYLAERLRRWLVELISGGHLPPPERAAAGSALALLPPPPKGPAAGGDPRPGVGVEAGVPDILWCLVPPGPFLMGSRKGDDPDAYEDEMPQHEYDIAYPYFIARYPVTNAQFRAFVEDPEGYRDKRWWTEAGWEWHRGRTSPIMVGGVFGLPNHPAVAITWYEAVAWCRWLTWRLRQGAAGAQRAAPLPEGWQIRLPTEAEWEKAARGGLHIPTSPIVGPLGAQLEVPLQANPYPARRYPWGNSPDPALANYDDAGIGNTCAAGIFPGGESPCGCLDLSGNIWEWCATRWVGDYGGYLEREDNGLEGVAPRAVRGGAFYSNRRYVRCAYRGWGVPDNFGWSRGFRPVAAPV